MLAGFGYLNNSLRYGLAGHFDPAEAPESIADVIESLTQGLQCLCVK